MGKNWEEKSSSATHTLKNKNLVNVNYEKTILYIKVKVGADFAWSFWFIMTTKENTTCWKLC